MSKTEEQIKTIMGVVLSDKMDKTIVVELQRIVQHPRYKKYIRLKSKFHVHDEQNLAKCGDTVEITSTSPISKTKTWNLLRVVNQAK